MRDFQASPVTPSPAAAAAAGRRGEIMDWETSFSLSESSRLRVLHMRRRNLPSLTAQIDQSRVTICAEETDNSPHGSLGSQVDNRKTRSMAAFSGSARSKTLKTDRSSLVNTAALYDDANSPTKCAVVVKRGTKARHSMVKAAEQLPSRNISSRRRRPKGNLPVSVVSHTEVREDATDIEFREGASESICEASRSRNSRKRNRIQQCRTAPPFAPPLDAKPEDIAEIEKLYRRLDAEFFNCDSLELAPRLLGKHLRREGVILQITEVEAYRPNDSACHGRVGITARTAPLFGPGGHAYVYLCYGLHHMLNVVADREGVGAAVLIRSCAPVAGLEILQYRRGHATNKPMLLNGPGKVGQALGLTTEWCNHPLYAAGGLEILDGPEPKKILVGPRVGINYATPDDVKALWRFAIAGSQWISPPQNTLRPAQS